MFFFLLILSFAADRYKARNTKEVGESSIEQEEQDAIPYDHGQIYKELLEDQKGNTAQDEATKTMRQEMKNFLRKTIGHCDITKISIDELKSVCGEETNISRIKYRRQVGKIISGKRKEIAKKEIFKAEHAHASNLADEEKNSTFGFFCLHYSVSEASEKLKIKILNKQPNLDSCKVRVATIDAEAKAGEDFEEFDKVITFNKGESE
jgi:hypothetical protein